MIIIIIISLWKKRADSRKSKQERKKTLPQTINVKLAPRFETILCRWLGRWATPTPSGIVAAGAISSEKWKRSVYRLIAFNTGFFCVPDSLCHHANRLLGLQPHAQLDKSFPCGEPLFYLHSTGCPYYFIVTVTISSLSNSVSSTQSFGDKVSPSNESSILLATLSPSFLIAQ